MSNNPILASDLYKDDGALRAAIAEVKEFKNEYVTALKTIKKESTGLAATVKSLTVLTGSQRSDIAATSKQLEKMANDAAKYKTGIKQAETTLNSLAKAQKDHAKTTELERGSLRDLQAQLKINRDALAKMNEATIAGTKEGYKLKDSTDRLKAAIDNKNRASKQATDVARLEKIAASAQVGSYNQLSAQYSLLKIKLNGLSEEERANTKEGQRMERQSNAIYAQMNKLQEATGKHTLKVGNYTGAIAPLLAKQQQLINQLARMEAEFKSLPVHVQRSAQAQQYHSKAVAELKGQIQGLEATTGRQVSANVGLEKSNTSLWQSAKNLLGAYLGLSAIKGVFGNILGQTTQLSSLDNAYSKIIKNGAVLAQTQGYLTKLADTYGSSIFQLKSQYLKYTAAVQTSNLPISEQQYIFEAITKASAILGLSTEEQGRAFTALQQIMSKGVVAAEELKGQLGDVLPGAVNIMARALGVSVKELGKLQEQGKVLAEDAMPKFARELEKAYGVESSAKITNVAAAQGRFQTAVTNTIAKLEASDAIKSMYETMAAGVKIIGDNITLIFGLTKAIVALTVGYVTYKGTMAAINVFERLRVANLVSLTVAQTGLNVATTAGAVATGALNTAVKLNPLGLFLSVLTTAISLLGVFTDKLDFAKKLFGDRSTDAVKGYQEEKAKLENLIEAAKRNNDNQEVRKILYDQIKERYPEYLENIDLEKEGIEGLNKVLAEYNNINTLGYAKEAVRLQKINELQREKHDILLTIAEIEARPNADDFFNRAAVKSYTKDIDVLDKKIKDLALQNVGKTNRGGVFKHTDTQKDVPETKKTQEEIDAEKKKNEEIAKLNKEARERKFKQREQEINLLEDGLNKELKLLELNNDKQIIEFKETGANLELLKESYEKNIESIGEKYRLKRDKDKIDRLPDGNEKDLANLKFEFDNQKKLYEGLKIDTNVLESEYAKKRGEIIDKANEEELAKADKAVTDRIALMEDGIAKQKAELDHEYEVKKRSTENLLELDMWYDRQLKKLEADNADKTIDKELEIFDQKQSILKSEFEGVKHTEKEKADFAIKTEIAKLKKILELNKQFNGTLTELGKQAIEAQIKLLDSQLKGNGKESKDIYDLLGFNIPEEKKKLIGEAFNFAAGQLADYAAKRTEIANQNVEQKNQEVDEAQKTLSDEINNRNLGYASEVETARKRLDLAKKQQKEALRDRAAAQKTEIALDTALQSSNLITATTKILKLGFPWFIPALALMWGSFAIAKVKAFQAVKTYGKGGYEDFDYGGRHGSGNDIPIGVNRHGQTMVAERGEGQAIFNRQAVSKYGNNVLKSLTQSVNNLTFGNADIKPIVRGIQIYQPLRPNKDNSFDTKQMEGHLSTLVKNSETKYVSNGKDLVKVRKNVTTIWKAT